MLRRDELMSFPIVDGMGMAWTRSGNVSKKQVLLDRSRRRVEGIDTLPERVEMRP